MSQQSISNTNKRSRAEGKEFESLIINACACYSRTGVAEIAKNEEARQVIGRTGGRSSQMICVNAKKALPDFAGTLAGGKSIYLEAKYTDKRRIAYDRVTEYQLDILRKHSELGAECYILVSFGFEKYLRVPYAVWRDMKTIFGRKYISVTDDTTEYEIGLKGGFLQFLEGVV